MKITEIIFYVKNLLWWQKFSHIETAESNSHQCREKIIILRQNDTSKKKLKKYIIFV